MKSRTVFAILGPVFALLFLALQLLLCCKCRRTVVRLIPALLLLVGFGFCAALWLGAFGHGGGFLDGASIGAAIFALFLGIASTGVVLGWGIWGISRLAGKGSVQMKK